MPAARRACSHALMEWTKNAGTARTVVSSNREAMITTSAEADADAVRDAGPEVQGIIGMVVPPSHGGARARG
ncbi:hypothetical protein, partial [Clavibacter michiganensis]|uniref:hypothetical protein n=1 Tax=Clavibacter michiganensis TaxID=28447 RepID=UPI00292F1062